LFPIRLKLSFVSVSLLFLFFAISSHLTAQTASQISGSDRVDSASVQAVPGQQDKIPQPGELGSPFPVDHSWKRIGLELSGGYSPVAQKGAGYLSNGFNVTAGVIDHVSLHWTLLAEVHIFGLRGSSLVDNGSGSFAVNYSNTIAAPSLGVAYDFFSRPRTSPYVIGGIGYYLFGPVTMSGSDISDLTEVNAANSVGYNGGIGVRHRLYDGRRMEIFAEGRYHYIASGSTDFGQISMFPVSAGIRW
jgi:hypothetical protein